MNPSLKNGLQVASVFCLQAIPVVFAPLSKFFLPVLLLNAFVSLVFVIKSPTCFNWIALFKNHMHVKSIAYGAVLGLMLGFAADWIIVPAMYNWLKITSVDTSTETLTGNLKLTMLVLISVWLTSGICHEMVFRGFVFERLKQITKSQISALFISTLMVGLLFLNQGLAVALAAFIMSLVFGLIYINSKFNLLQNMVMHAVADSVFFIAVYLNLPTAL